MKVLKANEAQYKELNGYENLPYILEFTKDAYDNWIIGVEVLSCDYFSSIMDKLEQLERIEYTPYVEEIN